MSHHGIDPEQHDQILHEEFKKLFGEFPDGRLRPSDHKSADEGAIPMIIAHEKGRVTIAFARNLNWVGFTPEQAVDIAQRLVEHARKCSGKPFALKIG